MRFFRLVEVYETKEATSSLAGIVPRKLFAAVEHHADISSFAVHPFLGVKPNEAWDECVDGMITAYADLRYTLEQAKENNNNVWKRTCWPGWNCVPRWRTIMLPGITA